MKENERIDYLIRTLEGNNARAFADKTGIRTDNLSRARNGHAQASLLFTRILSAYPEVRRDWLMDEQGPPFVRDQERSELMRKIEELTEDVKSLRGMVEQLVKRG